MNGTTDRPDVTIDDDAPLDPVTARALMQDSERTAARRLEFDPPRFSLVGAVMIFIAYGALYMSTRGQDPYKRPHGLWLIVVPVVIAFMVTLNITVFQKMSKSVNGASLRRRNGMSLVTVAVLICVYTLDGALKNAGASNAIVYGVFDAAGPVLMLAAITAASAAERQDYPALVAMIALMCVATGSAFAGPHGAWGVIAIGGCLSLVGHAVLKAVWERGWRPGVAAPVQGPGATL